jgi:hypothetical protein
MKITPLYYIIIIIHKLTTDKLRIKLSPLHPCHQVLKSNCIFLQQLIAFFKNILPKLGGKNPPSIVPEI